MPWEVEITMSSGGARNRSGRTAAATSELGIQLNALPSAGHRGRTPKFPLRDCTERESQVWKALWRTPQACAWSLPSEKWRLHTIALYVRTLVRCEDLEAPASLLAQLHRFADQIGMTTAGLSEMGWKVAVDEVGQARAAAAAKAGGEDRPEPTPRRLRAASG
jgi:hypothetical protein